MYTTSSPKAHGDSGKNNKIIFPKGAQGYIGGITGRKTTEDIKNLHSGAVILATILKELKNLTTAGKNCLELSDWAEKQIIKHGASISYYEPEVNFPAAICISVNDALVHGVPPDYILQDGDKVSFDLTIKYGTMHVDSAFTMIVGGKTTTMQRKLLVRTEEALFAGIKQAIPDNQIRDISRAVEKVLSESGLGIIRDYVGHGIGASMHMLPSIPNYVCPDRDEDYTLQVGDTICIEPMACLGKEKTYVGEDGWTVYMKDGSLPAHFEHTILITETGNEILTNWNG